MIKNIIFDLGGVILLDKPSSVLNELNLDDETLAKLSGFFLEWKNVDLGFETLEDKFLKCNFSSEIVEKYKEYLVNYYKYRKINLDLLDYAKQLKNKGYKLYILSDNNKEAYNYYKSQKQFEIYDGWVMSCEFHEIKRNKKLFEILLEKYNLTPNECYFIDDNIVNVQIAKKLGMNTCHFDANQPKIFEKNLEKFIKKHW